MSDSPSDPIRFRPHHFLCTLGFEGKGYNGDFVANFAKIADRLRAEPDGDARVIDVAPLADSICGPCPNRRGELCETQEKIETLDRAHAAVLGLRAGERLTWGEAKARVREKFTIEAFHAACAPCSWKEMGVCEKALRRLKDEEPATVSAARGFAGLAGFATLTALSIALLGSMPAAAAPKTRRARETASAASTAVSPSPTPSAAASAVPAPKASNVPTPAASPAASASAAPSSAVSAESPLVLPKKPAKKYLQLAKAEKAFAARKWAEVVSTCAPYLGDADLGDHAQGLRGLAYLELAAEARAANDWAGVARHAAAARGLFQNLARGSLYSPWFREAPEREAQAELQLGEAAAAGKKYAEAIRSFENALQRLVNESSIYLVEPSSLEAYAKACRKRRSVLCESWITRLSNTYAKNTKESKTLAESFPEIVAQAKPNFANSKITTGYKQKDSDEVAFDLAFQPYLQSKYSDAKDAFEKFLADFPRSSLRFRARYWLAASVEKDANLEKAKPQYEQLLRESPLTLYGMLAAWKLGANLSDRFAAKVPELSPADPYATPVEVFRMRRIPSLVAAKAFRSARLDFRDFRVRDSSANGYLFYLADLETRAGYHLGAFVAYTELIQRSDESVYGPYGLDRVFPLAYWSEIQSVAGEVGLDPVFLLSLAKQESAFDAEAHSSVGASGLMQLMPFTASDVDGEVKRAALLDPRTNLRIGAKYVARLIQKYNGNLALALAGYNAGPTTVDRWVRDGKSSLGMLEFIEQIPYKETRDYVGTIFRNYVWYQQRLNQLEIRDVSPFWPIGPQPKP